MTSQVQVVLELVTTSFEIIGSLLAKAGSTSSQNSDACKSLNIVEFLAYCPSKVEDPTLFCDSECIISGTLLILYSVDEDGIYGIVYGSNSGCWIGGPKINLYAFGIPVAVSVVINMIFFIHITVSICIQKRSSRRIRKTKEESHLRELVIYSKIFIILGLTWVIGFAAALFDKPWLWYLFIIFTSLQGLFIFLAFTVKSEIWGMWRKRLGMSSDSYISSSQGVYYQPGKGKKTSGLTATSTV
ncbi:putative G-protein coupled receptor [Apostichopus japonicus]|uniref:Putative G-protein coupled receptor n=1 Tax=Stichopus japonicus TaxID=307972 RepID=A0A2G8JYB9_STIJA|nr:putative G-protein coupled receptor [Apostichopus japonicus]